jgi:hypothetical protein
MELEDCKCGWNAVIMKIIGETPKENKEFTKACLNLIATLLNMHETYNEDDKEKCAAAVLRGVILVQNSIPMEFRTRTQILCNDKNPLPRRLLLKYASAIALLAGSMQHSKISHLLRQIIKYLHAATPKSVKELSELL